MEVKVGGCCGLANDIGARRGFGRLVGVTWAAGESYVSTTGTLGQGALACPWQ